jgi:hypothetical protein
MNNQSKNNLSILIKILLSVGHVINFEEERIPSLGLRRRGDGGQQDPADKQWTDT